MEPPEATIGDAPHEPIFRSAKRRKIVRPRTTFTEPQPVDATLPNPPPQSDDAEDAQAGDAHSVAEILRMRKAAKTKRFGVEFGGAKSNALVGRSHHVEDRLGTTSATEAAAKRFAPQTGPIVELDTHMMKYIDSRMAEIHRGSGSADESEQHEPRTTTTTTTSAEGEAAMAAAKAHRELLPAGLGRLQEVDLGPLATQENIRRTQAATRRLEGVVESEEDEGPVRKGKNGRPWRRRKRRNSDDVRRDQLVEQVLKESRLDLYDESAVTSPQPSGNDQAADEIVAERFRREFMEAQTKNARRAPPPAQKAKPGEEKPKGPKLGGSRSARAALRAMEEKGKKK